MPEKETNIQEKQKIKKTELTIEEILTTHATNQKILALQPRSAQGYRRSLLRVVYCGSLQLEGKYAPMGRLTEKETRLAEKMPVSILTRQLARAYLQSAIEEIDDLEQLESAKRTANMTLRQAKSIFSQEAIELYEDTLSLSLPDISQFKSKKPLAVQIAKYCLPQTETIKAFFKNYDSLQLNSPKWIALSLAVFGGLRRSETIAARQSWLSNSQGAQIHIRTESDFKPKGKKSRNVPIEDNLYDLLIKNEGEFIINNNLSEREKIIDDINQELREIFPGVQKPFHELRKLYGCWISEKKGIREAQRRLGHSSIDTTEKYYADINMSAEINNLFEKSLNKITSI